MSRTRAHSIRSLIALLCVVALWAHLRSPEPKIEGVWEQYMVSGDDYRFIARFRLEANGEDYQDIPLELTPDCNPKAAFLSVDHDRRDGRWSFREEWGEMGSGKFELVEQFNGDFVGVATTSKGKRFETCYRRVGD